MLVYIYIRDPVDLRKNSSCVRIGHKCVNLGMYTCPCDMRHMIVHVVVDPRFLFRGGLYDSVIVKGGYKLNQAQVFFKSSLTSIHSVKVKSGPNWV